MATILRDPETNTEASTRLPQRTVASLTPQLDPLIFLEFLDLCVWFLNCWKTLPAWDVLLHTDTLRPCREQTCIVVSNVNPSPFFDGGWDSVLAQGHRWPVAVALPVFAFSVECLALHTKP